MQKGARRKLRMSSLNKVGNHRRIIEYFPKSSPQKYFLHREGAFFALEFLHFF